MPKTESGDYRAKITNDTGIVRAKVPSPVVRTLGGRPGDFLHFKFESDDQVTMTVVRTRRPGKKSVSKATSKKKSGGR